MRKIYTAGAQHMSRDGSGVEEGGMTRKKYKRALLQEKKKY